MTRSERLQAFARWVIQEGPWSGCHLDGASIQEKAAELGLIEKTTYDPAAHGPNDVDAEEGDTWFVFTEILK